jgi:hypothetical protein
MDELAQLTTLAPDYLARDDWLDLLFLRRPDLASFLGVGRIVHSPDRLAAAAFVDTHFLLRHYLSSWM